MIDVNRYVLEQLQYPSKEERDEMLEILKCCSHDPKIKLILGILRDSLVFRSMAQSHIIRQDMKLQNFERRLELVEAQVE